MNSGFGDVRVLPSVFGRPHRHESQSLQGEVEEAFGLLSLLGLGRGEGDAGEGGEHVGRADVGPDRSGSVLASMRVDRAA